MAADASEHVFYSDYWPFFFVILAGAAVVAAVILWPQGADLPDPQAVALVTASTISASAALAWWLRRQSATRVSHVGLSAWDMRGARQTMPWSSITSVRKVRWFGSDTIAIASTGAERSVLVELKRVRDPAFRAACEAAGPDHPLNVFIRRDAANPHEPGGGWMDVVFGDDMKPGGDNAIAPTRRGRIKLAVLFGLGLAIEFGFKPLTRYVRSLPGCEQAAWWQGIFVAMTALCFVVSAVLARRAVRIFASGQTPPPGMAVFFRTHVRRGWRAKLDAVGFLFTAAMLLAIPIVMWIVFDGMALFTSEACWDRVLSFSRSRS